MIVGKIKDKDSKMSTNYEARLGKQAVRMFWKNGNPWRVLKDVSQIFGIGNSSEVSSRLENGEKDDVHLMDPIGRQRLTTVVSESGLYSVILRSDKPDAVGFKRWAYHEVIPQIRSYLNNNGDNNGTN